MQPGCGLRGPEGTGYSARIRRETHPRSARRLARGRADRELRGALSVVVPTARIGLFNASGGDAILPRVDACLEPSPDSLR